MQGNHPSSGGLSRVETAEKELLEIEDEKQQEHKGDEPEGQQSQTP
jgi:hypothetical protein